MKKHKKGLDCGISVWDRTSILSTENIDEVTCKKCLRLIADDKPNKLYEVSYDYVEVKIISAPTASKAIYKCFKNFDYFDEACESIGEQFNSFRKNGKPKAKRIKDKTMAASLTFEEERQLELDTDTKKCEDWNLKNPIGTKVLFQADFTDYVVVTTTRSEAQMLGSSPVIFLNDVSGCYSLDSKFVRRYEGNEYIERLRA